MRERVIWTRKSESHIDKRESHKATVRTVHLHQAAQEAHRILAPFAEADPAVSALCATLSTIHPPVKKEDNVANLDELQKAVTDMASLRIELRKTDADPALVERVEKANREVQLAYLRKSPG